MISTHYDPGRTFYCGSLTNVTIGTNVTIIGDQVFESCNKLTGIIIPNSVTSLGAYTFVYCTSLTNVTIGTNVTSIGSSAFANCTSLTNITIGKGFTNSANGNLFSYCTNLLAISVDALNPAYSSVAGVLFNKNQTSLVAFPGGKTGSYTIPNSVTNIGSSAFEYCTSLTNVTSIGGGAFYSCTSLISIYFMGNAPSANTTVFDSAGGIVYYLPGTSGWGATFGGAPTWNPQTPTSNTAFGIRTNRFGFNIIGNNNLIVVVEAATNLANSIWTPVGTNTLTTGSSYFSDPQWTNYPARYYHLRSP